MLAAEPYPGAVEAIRGWHEAGHFIHVTSHRTTEAHDATERWLEQIGLPYDELYCSFDKVARCREIGIEVLIDDSPVTLHGGGRGGYHPRHDRCIRGTASCARRRTSCAHRTGRRWRGAWSRCSR